MKYKGLPFARTLLLTFIMLGCVVRHTQAQNLVPNADFEAYNSCPAMSTPTYYAIANSPGYTSFPTVKDWVDDNC